MSPKSGYSYALFAVIGLGCIGGLYLYVQPLHEDTKRRPVTITTSTIATGKLGGRKRRSLKPNKKHTVEICLSDLQSLREACAGGCSSIELCSNRIEGGMCCMYF